MARPRLPAHLILRPARTNAKGKVTHAAVWLIKDGEHRESTRCSETNYVGAEEQLQGYLTKKQALKVLEAPDDKVPAKHFPIASVIARYTVSMVPRYHENADEGKKARPKQESDFMRRMDALLDYFGDKTVTHIKHDTCKTFSKLHAASTARRCLEDLRSAVDNAIASGAMIDERINFWLPPARKPRYRFYTRSQVAQLVWTAYRRRGSYTFTSGRSSGEKIGKKRQTDARPQRHIARFMLTAAYTGTRTERIEQASFVKESGRPWIDLEHGIYYRAWDGDQAPENKRADPIRLPDRLLAHMRRWHKNGAKYLIEFHGKPGSTAAAFFRLLKEIIPDDKDRKGLNRHAFRHTCATWLMSAGEELSQIAGYLAIDEKTLIKHYGHHHPNHQFDIGNSFTTGSAGKVGVGPKQRAAFGKVGDDELTKALIAERRRALLDLVDITDAPVEIITLVEDAPAATLLVLKERIKRAARLGSWDELVPPKVAAE